jgi:hypothetical protein
MEVAITETTTKTTNREEPPLSPPRGEAERKNPEKEIMPSVKEKRFAAVKELTRLGASVEDVEDWLAFRKSRKKSVNARILKLLIGRAAKAGISVARAVCILADNQWLMIPPDYVPKETDKSVEDVSADGKPLKKVKWNDRVRTYTALQAINKQRLQDNLKPYKTPADVPEILLMEQMERNTAHQPQS